MKILYITGLYPKEHYESLNHDANGLIQNAPNVIQWAVLEGLVLCKADFEVISCPFLPSYPNTYKKLFTPASSICYNDRFVGNMLSYCNLIGFKTHSIKNTIRSYISQWADRNSQNGERLVILTYTPYPPFLPSLERLKKRYNLTIASLVTDLVDDMMNFRTNRSILKRIQVWDEVRSTRKLYPLIDKYILLSRHMIEKIPQAKNQYIVVEGIATKKNLIMPKTVSKIKTFLYTGTLEHFSCIDCLVNAFLKINNPDVRLIICGSGPLSEMITDAANKDSRIDFRGLVSRKEAIRLQKECNILVNPRKPDGGITKYSFPSKTIEYLSSGTPMIGYKLEGIPEEYYSYYYTIDQLDELSLIHTMEEVASKQQEELNLKAKIAYEFIQHCKTSEIQVKKMMNFLEKS